MTFVLFKEIVNNTCRKPNTYVANLFLLIVLTFEEITIIKCSNAEFLLGVQMLALIEIKKFSE